MGGEISLKVEIRGADEFRHLMAIAPGIVRDELWDAGDAVGEEALQRVRKFTPVVSGRLERGLYYEVTQAGNDTTAVIGGEAPYSLWAEQGRGPGRAPPPGALDSWCASVLGDARLAFVVGRKIARKGTKPGARMFARALGERPDLALLKNMARRRTLRARDNIVARILLAGRR